MALLAVTADHRDLSHPLDGDLSTPLDDQDERMANPAAAAEPDWDDATLQAWYGTIAPLEPAAVAALLEGSGVRWWVAGGRAARVGAALRHHEDTDVAIGLADLPALRRHLPRWHFWEAASGTLRPLLPGAPLSADGEQLWLRRDAQHPWEIDLLLQRGEAEWVFKKDPSVHLPWAQALHTVGGIRYLRPELALLHKAHLNRAKDRADLAAAVLTPDARTWLADTLERLGHQEWARETRGRR